MARPEKDSGEYLDHLLVSPREEEVVHGEAVTFVWRPVDRAREYRLQVARDSSFEEVVLDQHVSDATTLTVKDTFGTADETLYWRVLAVDEHGDVRGENVIESFIAGTEEEAQRHMESPDRDEDVGPLEGLIKGASAEVAAEVTGRDEYLRLEEEMGVAHEGIEAGQILGITVAIAAALVAAIVVVFQYAQITAQETRRQAVGLSGYPELREARAEATRLLSEYAVVDREEGVYRIPIDRAMDLIVREAREEGSPGQAPAEQTAPDEPTAAEQAPADETAPEQD